MRILWVLHDRFDDVPPSLWPLYSSCDVCEKAVCTLAKHALSRFVSPIFSGGIGFLRVSRAVRRPVASRPSHLQRCLTDAVTPRQVTLVELRTPLALR